MVGMLPTEEEQLEQAWEQFVRYLRLFRHWWMEKIGTLKQYPHVFPTVFSSKDGLQILQQLANLCRSLAYVTDNSIFERNIDAHEAFSTTYLFPLVTGATASRVVEDFFHEGRFKRTVEHMVTRRKRDIQNFPRLVPLVTGYDINYLLVEAIKRTGSTDVIEAFKAVFEKFRKQDDALYDYILHLAFGQVDAFWERYGVDLDKVRSFNDYAERLLLAELHRRGRDVGSILPSLSGISIVRLGSPFGGGLSGYLVISKAGHPALKGEERFGFTVVRLPLSDKSLQDFLLKLVGVERANDLGKVAIEAHKKLWAAYNKVLASPDSKEDPREIAREYVDAWEEFLSIVGDLGLVEDKVTLRDIWEIFNTHSKEEIVKAVANHIRLRRERKEGLVFGMNVIVSTMKELWELFTEAQVFVANLYCFIPQDVRQKFIAPIISEHFFDRNLLGSSFWWRARDVGAVAKIVETFLTTGEGEEDVVDIIGRTHARAFPAVDKGVVTESEVKGLGWVFIYPLLYKEDNPAESIVAIKEEHLWTLENYRRDWLDRLIREVEAKVKEIAGDTVKDEEWQGQLFNLLGASEPVKPLRIARGRRGQYALLPLKVFLDVAKPRLLRPTLVAQAVLAPFRGRFEGREMARMNYHMLGADVWRAAVHRISNIIIELERLIMMAHGGGSFIESLSYDRDAAKMFRKLAELFDAWVAKSRMLLRKYLLSLFLRKVLKTLGYY